jgi:hypothetical protein
MADGTINYEEVLADLREKRSGLDAAIAAIEKMLGLACETSVGGSKAVETAVSEDSFLGMSTPLAAERYLRLAKKPKTTAEIAEALQNGGIHSTSENFVNTVYTALSRNDKVIRLGRGRWSLREWHPGARVEKKPARGVSALMVSVPMEEDEPESPDEG